MRSLNKFNTKFKIGDVVKHINEPIDGKSYYLIITKIDEDFYYHESFLSNISHGFTNIKYMDERYIKISKIKIELLKMQKRVGEQEQLRWERSFIDQK